jgi:hypothetical protein
LRNTKDVKYAKVYELRIAGYAIQEIAQEMGIDGLVVRDLLDKVRQWVERS